jgi:hypothetical protein
MQSQTAPIPHGVPESFYSKFGHQVTAILSGFDQISAETPAGPNPFVENSKAEIPEPPD